MENKLQTWFKSHEGADWAILYLRLFIGTIILLHNVGKMQAYNEIINYYPSWGIFGSASFSLRSPLIEVLCAHFAHAGLQSPPVRRDHGRQSAHLAVIPLPRQRIRNLRTAVRLSGNPGSLVISGGGVYSLDALASAKRAKSQRTRNSSRRIEDSTKK